MPLSRRTLISSAAAAGSAALLSACSPKTASGPATSAGGTTDIRFSYLWGGAESEVLQKLTSTFNSQQSAVKVAAVSAPDMQKQLTSMSSKKGSFDVSDHFGQAVGSWASKGVITPLDDLLAKRDVKTDDFVTAAMNQMRYQGKLYSMPIAVHTFQLLYNKTMLDEAGVKPPTTIDELAAAVEKLTKVDASGKIVTLGLGAPETYNTLTTLAYAFGGHWHQMEGETARATPDDPANVAALKWYQDTIVKRYGGANLTKFKASYGQYMSAQDPFYSGKVAMIIDGAWHRANIEKVAPKFQWGVTAMPTLNAGLAGTSQLTASTLFIPTNSERKEQAADFLKYLLDPKALGEFATATGNLAPRKSMAEAAGDDPRLKVWTDSLTSDKLQTMTSAPFVDQYTTDLGTVFDLLVVDKIAPAEAMSKVAGQAKSYAK